MREGIHPQYNQVNVKCNCGNEFVTGSTKDEIKVYLKQAVELKNSTKNTAESNFCKIGRVKVIITLSSKFNENEKCAESLSLHFFIYSGKVVIKDSFVYRLQPSEKRLLLEK